MVFPNAVAAPHHRCWARSVSIVTAIVSLMLPPYQAASGQENLVQTRLVEDGPKAWEAYRRFWLVLQGSSLIEDRALIGAMPSSRIRHLRKQYNGFDLRQIED